MKAQCGLLTMELTTEMAELMRDLFDIETEMLQGKVEDLPNNLKRYTIKIPMEKGKVVKEFILRSIANQEQMVMN
jgi:hypothetical protein